MATQAAAPRVSVQQEQTPAQTQEQGPPATMTSDRGSTAEEAPAEGPTKPTAAVTLYVSAHEVVSFLRWALGEHFLRVADAGAEEAADLAWVHTVTRQDKQAFSAARLRGGNAVAGTSVLEDKFKLALLMSGIDADADAETPAAGHLRSFAVEGAEAVAQLLGGLLRGSGSGSGRRPVWIVKDAGANCGDGLHVVSASNREATERRLRAADAAMRRPVRYVVQKYVEAPQLHLGRFKFHMRVYLVLRGDMSAYVHARALLHVANKPYSLLAGSLEDAEVHLTNVSKNHHNADLFHGCPIVDLAAPEPAARARLARMKALFAAVFLRARPFMARQLGAADFSHIGADVMFDEAGQPLLLECNVPPCIGNYRSDMADEQHRFFQGLFGSMVRTFVRGPLEGEGEGKGKGEGEGEGEGEDELSEGGGGKGSGGGVDRGANWLEVCGPCEGFVASAPSSLGLNALAWKVFETKAKRKQAQAQAAFS